jgi:hypothetical protein
VTLVTLGTATAAVDGPLTLDLNFAVVFVRVVVFVVVVVIVLGSPDGQGYRSVRRYTVLFPVVARPSRTTVKCVQAALAPQQTRPRRCSVRVVLLTRLVRSQSHLRELTRVDLAKELLVRSAPRAAFVESVLENALTLTVVGMTRRTAAVWPLVHSDARRRATLCVAILVFIAATWRLGRATSKVVETVSIPALRSLGWGIVTVGQVVCRLAVAVTKARHG